MRLSRNERLAISTLAISLASSIMAQESTALPNLSSAAASASSAAAAASTTTDTSSTTSQTSTSTSSSSLSGSQSTATPSSTQLSSTDRNTAPTSTISAPPLPTLTAINSGADTINTYPAPSVPPTSSAPFMQTSSLPTNTVFIIVGAILVACTLGIFVWKGVVAWSLKRSVRKAAFGMVGADLKRDWRAPKPPTMPVTSAPGDKRGSAFYGGGGGAAGYRDRDLNPTKADRGSVISLNVLKTTRRSSQVPSIHDPANTTNSSSRPGTSGAGTEENRKSLFFSPTNRGGPGTPGSGTPGTGSLVDLKGGNGRGSAYFPPGFYAAAGGGGLSPGVSMANLAGNGGYQRAGGFSPPDSPGGYKVHGDAGYRDAGGYSGAGGVGGGYAGVYGAGGGGYDVSEMDLSSQGQGYGRGHARGKSGGSGGGRRGY